MFKFELKNVIVLLGIVFCIGLLPMEASAETENDEKAENNEKTDKTSESPVSDGGLTIVLRAPTSGRHYLVKCPGSENEKRFKEGVLSLSLPKNTPISFRIDQVNTVLYEIEITVKGEKSQAKTSKSPDFPDALDLIGKAIDFFSSPEKISGLTALNGEAQEANGIVKALGHLEEKIKAIVELNRKLDKLLYLSETPQFYKAKNVNGVLSVNEAFAGIQKKAEVLTRESLNLSTPGTSQAICDEAMKAIECAHDAFKKVGLDPFIVCLPKDLSETSNEIVSAVLTTARKLQSIETAKWTEADTETRFLKDQVKYICVFTPKDENTSLEQITRVVTVKGEPTGLIIRTTQGTFVSGLVNETYVLDPPLVSDPTEARKIKLGTQDTVRLSAGAFAHVFHSKFKWIGLTAALGVDGAKNPQVALGPSLLMNADEERLFALTFGGIFGRVETLEGYAKGDKFIGETLPTKTVNRISWFGAITLKFDSLIGITGDSKSSEK